MGLTLIMSSRRKIRLGFQMDNAMMKRHGEGFETSPAPNRNGSLEDHVMASKSLPSPEVLRQLLRYEPETGKLFWRERSAESFTSKSEKTAHWWGKKFAGKEGFTHLSKRGYLVSSIDGRTVSAHRAAWAIHYNEYPSGQVDHINGDRTDNRLVNLRDVVQAENARNAAMSSLNTSGVQGVYLHRQTGKWCAQIRAFGKTVGLGLFQAKSDAIIARKAAERVLGYHPNHGRPHGLTAATQDKLGYGQ